MQGWCFFACSNKSRTLLAPTPTNISTKSEPDIEKKGTPASPATAFAIKVLPVPGAPTKRTPFGIFAPNFVYFSGFLRKSTISSSSCLSSSIPATSLNVIFTLDSCSILALDLPKFIAAEPPCWMPFKIKIIIIMKNTGTKIEPIVDKMEPSCGFLTLISTEFSSNTLYNESVSLGIVTLY